MVCTIILFVGMEYLISQVKTVFSNCVTMKHQNKILLSPLIDNIFLRFRRRLNSIRSALIIHLPLSILPLCQWIWNAQLDKLGRLTLILRQQASMFDKVIKKYDSSTESVTANANYFSSTWSSKDRLVSHSFFFLFYNNPTVLALFFYI